jgi:linoleoyl-CoA desaturase
MTQKKQRAKFTNPNKSQFLKALKTKVDGYFEEKNISKGYNTAMVIKTITLLSVYIVPFIISYCFHLPNIVLICMYLISGFGLAGVGMSVMHDANHGSYSDSKLLNNILGKTLNILGGYDLNWRLQHNVLHHTYTNISHIDEDISPRLKMRWSPYFDKHWVQKYQHFYAFFAYLLSTLSWIFIKDFKQLITYYRNGVYAATKARVALDLVILFFIKSSYLAYSLIIPATLLHYGWGISILGFVGMHFIGGFLLSTIFQLAHVVEGTEFPMPNEKGEVENEWAIHQLLTTADFAHGNKVLTWFAGGLHTK